MDLFCSCRLDLLLIYFTYLISVYLCCHCHWSLVTGLLCQQVNIQRFELHFPVIIIIIIIIGW
jgi:hypothetical protein